MSFNVLYIYIYLLDLPEVTNHLYMKFIFPLIAILLFSSLLNAQSLSVPQTGEPQPLSFEELEALKKLPQLKLPDHYRNKSLPGVVDNSTQPYMRNVFQQHMYCCGQAAGIAYNFTYEMDRERDIPANTNENLYPTHFTWNWMNDGYGYYGASFLHSFQVLKHCGNMNVTDYGGSLSFGGESRWISGYNEYYRGMSNRINDAFQIQVGTPDGLETFKHWINDHLEGAAVGGVGSFYSQYMGASNTLPSGTPEEGKYVLTYFGGSANHAQTIVGYNDSIRWDYNGDGQYTNDIDINGDGEVDMKDWEIGGFKMVQSYGGVPNWGDQGYAYMMYKTVADVLGEGGIWNHSVFVLDVKESCTPQATMKVTMTHNKRNRLKVIAGISNDILSVYPQHILEFPILNYQGGGQFMQGGWSPPENRTLEFGLDISPLLSEIDLGQDVKFFLQVYEYDPDHMGHGEINSFSVIDYTSGSAVEHVCSQTNVNINDHDLTSLTVNAGIDFDRVHITNSAMPAAIVGQPYSAQLYAGGGEEPYTFRLVKKYDESISTEAFPMINQNQLSPGNSSSGFVTQSLDFDFPYYDSVYSSITVHVDGYLMFDEQLYPYPYFIDDKNLFNITRHISPFMAHDIRLYSSDGDGIWYEGDATQATFRWNASIDGESSSTDINMAVRLFPSGRIDFLYGDIVIGDHVNWVAGLSDGNEDDRQLSDFYFDALPVPDSRYRYERYAYPEGLEVSEEGLITGTVTQPVNGETMTFKVTDNNFVYDIKSLIFSTSGIQIMDSIVSGGDALIEYGEVASLSVELTNLESGSISDANMTISTTDPYITILDDNQYIGEMLVGVPIMLDNAFSFQVASDIPDDHMFIIETSIIGSTKEVWESELTYFAYAPDIELLEVVIDDGQNGRLDPGETADMILHIKNNGGSAASMLDCILDCLDPLISINSNNLYVSDLKSDSSTLLTYNISVDASTSIGHIVSFDLGISGNMGFETNLVFDQRIGLTLEDFETGDFHLFNWGFKGDREWTIDAFHPYEGDFCARSGAITHSQESSMMLDIEVLQNGDISFYRMVSCEDDNSNNNYDYLAFYIDDVEQARWDSITSWEEVSFPISSGYHRVEWKYTKDGSESVGLDAAFIDYISFPGCLDMNPHLSFDPVEFDKGMKPNEQDTDTLLINNMAEGELEYSIIIASLTDSKSGGGSRSIDGSYLECDQTEFFAGEPFTWSFTLYNASDDNEWLTDLAIQLPDGIESQTATNFTGGSNGDLGFTGSFGNGSLMNWHGEDTNNWGAVKGGEYAQGEISGLIDNTFSGDATLSYSITGDQFGSEPHYVEGNLVLTNLGGNVPWLSCDIYEGNITGSGQQAIMVTFNTDGMADGDYYCKLIIRDNFQHETIIPVHLLVDTYLGIEDFISSNTGVEVFPNPFSNTTNIQLSLASEEEVSIRVSDLEGRTVSVITDGQLLPAGKHSFTWDVKDGSSVDNGMYFIIVERGAERTVNKVIRYE